MTGLPDTATGDAAIMPVLADSITKIGPQAEGRVVVSGSHGGIYPASLAITGGCRAFILHDAGRGLDHAGTAGLRWAEQFGAAAAAIDYQSAPIGQAAIMLAKGIVSQANAYARACGVSPGMACAQAARLLADAKMPSGNFSQISEAREVLQPEGTKRRLILMDSASLVEPQDAGQVIVTGSHGALFGNDPMNALRVDAAFVLFNDAGGMATSRLPLLEQRGIAAATVAASSAHIGDAHSTWRDGVISSVNAIAQRHGLHAGMRASQSVSLMLATD